MYHKKWDYIYIHTHTFKQNTFSVQAATKNGVHISLGMTTAN